MPHFDFLILPFECSMAGASMRPGAARWRACAIAIKKPTFWVGFKKVYARNLFTYATAAS